jgi:hypothetical protein
MRDKLEKIKQHKFWLKDEIEINKTLIKEPSKKKSKSKEYGSN